MCMNIILSLPHVGRTVTDAISLFVLHSHSHRTYLRNSSQSSTLLLHCVPYQMDDGDTNKADC